MILARPGAVVAATVDVCARMEFAEAWSVLEPLFSQRADLRDLLLVTRHARDPALVDDVVSLLRDDPLGAMAFLVRSDDERAAQEILNVFSVCTIEQAHALFGGLTAEPGPFLRAALRQAAPEQHFAHVLRTTDGGLRPDLVIDALRCVLPRARHLRDDVERAIERLERRPRSR